MLLMALPTMEELQALDDELIAEGVAVRQRPRKAMWRWGERVGKGAVDTMKDFEKFEALYAKLHPSVPLLGREFALMCATARGVAYRVSPPMIIGTVGVRPLDFVDIEPQEIERIRKADLTAYWELCYQTMDCLGLFTFRMSFPSNNPDANEMLSVGYDGLEGVARQLVAGDADRNIAHSLCIAAETISKSALAVWGHDDASLRRTFGHDIQKITEAIAAKAPTARDLDYLAVGRSLPPFNDTRYRPGALTAVQLHDLYRRVLFLSAEAQRRLHGAAVGAAPAGPGSVPPRTW